MSSAENSCENLLHKKVKQIFILSGQSNMAGRGGVITDHHHHRHWDGHVPLECQPHSSILCFNSKLQWVPAHEPLHADIDTTKVCGVGPGMVFANTIRLRQQLDLDGENLLGLVPCAVGGTAISEWERGQHLYDNMLKRARESLKGTSQGQSEIKALLWFQGESDTSCQHVAEAYKGNMEKFVHNVREDLNLPSLPIIQVALASGDEKFIEIVREAQKGISLPDVVCVDAMGLQLKEDKLHLTTEAQVQLGQLLADAYLTHFAGTALASCPKFRIKEPNN